MIGEGSNDGPRDLHALPGFQQHSGLVGELEMTRDAPQLKAEIDLAAGTDGHKTDVVGILQGRHLSAAIEGDVEFARQPVHLAVIEDVMVHVAAQAARIVELLQVDPRGGTAGDVADVVGARAARGQTEFLHRQQHLHGMARGDLADLQIGARRHVGIAAPQALCRVGKAAHLPGVEDAVGHAQPAHEGILRWRDIKEAVIFSEEDVDALGELSRFRTRHNLVPAVEWMAGALGHLLGNQLAASCDRAFLCQELQGVGPGWRAYRRSRRRGLAHGKAAREPLQPALLLVGEVVHVVA